MNDWMIRYRVNIILFISGIILAYITKASVGPPYYPIQWIAVVGCLGMVFSSFSGRHARKIGWIIALILLLFAGPVFIPVYGYQVSTAGWKFTDYAELAILAYFLTLGTLYFTMPRTKWEAKVFRLAFAGSLLVAGTTAYGVYASGGFNWPAIVCFKLTPKAGELVIDENESKRMPKDIRYVLESGGITGYLEPTYGGFEQKRPSKVIVVCSSQPPEPKMLFYPKKGSIAYYYDGAVWLKIPQDAEVYEGSYALLEPKNNDSILTELLQEGQVLSYSAYSW